MSKPQYRLVPVEPTPEMIAAAWRGFNSHPNPIQSEKLGDECMKLALEAAITAAPSPHRSVETNPPTAADGDKHGHVMVWTEEDGWDVCHWRHVVAEGYALWMPMLPEPEVANES